MLNLEITTDLAAPRFLTYRTVLFSSLKFQDSQSCSNRKLILCLEALLFSFASFPIYAREQINIPWYISDRRIVLLISWKGNELSSHEKTWRNLKCILLNQGGQSEKAPCYSNYMTPTIFQLCDLLGRQKIHGGRQGGEQLVGRTQRIWGQWKSSIYHHNDGYMSLFVQTQISTTSRLNPKISYRLWVILMGQCRFILGKKQNTTLVSDDNGGVRHGGRGPVGNLCTFPSVLLWN